MSTLDADIDRLVQGRHHAPHDLLGAHPTPDGKTVVRTLRPEADAVAVLSGSKRSPLTRIHAGGVFEGVLDAPPGDYRIEVTYGDFTHSVDDPYRWLPTLGD